MPKPQQPESWRRVFASSWPSITLIGLAAALVYANSFQAQFVFDGGKYIAQNERLDSLAACAQPRFSNRWLGYLTFGIDRQLSGDGKWSFHLNNLLIHAINGWLLFELVRFSAARSGAEPHTARLLGFCSTLVWTCHPLQTQSVTYVYQRFESLASLFYLATLVALTRAVGADKKAWLVASVAFGVAGTFCKAILVTAPVVVLVYDRVFLSGSWRELWRARRAYHLALSSVTLLVLGKIFTRVDGLKEHGFGEAGASVSRLDYLLNQSAVIVHYVRLWFVPVNQNLDYVWEVEENGWRLLLPLAAIAASLAAMGVLFFRTPKLGFLVFWFFAILAPTSSVVPIVDLAFEHRVYLPSAALSVLCVLGVAWSGRLATGAELEAKSLLVFTTVWAVLLGVATHERNKVYHDRGVLWHDVLSKAPHNFRACVYLSKHYESIDDPRRALQFARKAVDLNPVYYAAQVQLSRLQGEVAGTKDDLEAALRHALAGLEIKANADGYTNAGSLLLRLGRTEQARECFLRSAEIRPTSEAYINLALTCPEDPRSAAAYLRRALEIDPESATAHGELAVTLRQTGAPPEQVEKHLREALRLDPELKSAKLNLATHLASQGDPESARAIFEQLVATNPSPEVYLNAARACRESDPRQSVRYLRDALTLAPNSSPAHNDLAELLTYVYGKYDLAIIHLRKAIASDRNNLLAHRNLAVLLAAEGKTDEAVTLLEEALRRAPDYHEARERLNAIKAGQQPH